MLGKKVLSDKYVEQLYTLFEKKQWKTEEIGDSSVFDRFCERLAELDNDAERDLMLELTEKFLWVRLEMYEQYLLIAMKKMLDSYKGKLEKGKKVYICPLLPESDFGKLKSNSVILYLCQSVLLRTFTIFQDEQIRICETPEILKQHLDEIGMVILVDDFIGSGETALGCLEYLQFLENIWEKISIIALVSQEEGIVNISKEKNVPVYAAEIRKKGITGVYEEKEVTEKLEQMRKIEKILHVPEQYLLGYVQSESLVAMVKTPNNTLPFYWYEDMKSKSRAPFPRRGNIRVI